MTGPLAVLPPRYGAESLADVLPGALATLGVPGVADPLGLAGRLAGVRRLAVLLVDGLGWHQLPLATPHAPTLGELARDGRELTCGFPSTTPTSLVSLGTGAPPGAHGVLGFRVAVPGSDRVLTHVDWWDDPDPDAWQPLSTCWQRAAAAGVAVTVVSRPEYAGSGLTRAANDGGRYVGVGDPAALAGEMLAALRAGPGPALVYGYHPDLDRAGHLDGVDSASWRAAAADLDAALARLVAGLPADAALLVTADHGQLNVPTGHRIDLDADDRLRSGLRAIAGEPRVRYLYARPGAAPDVRATWAELLGDAAWVLDRAEAVATGWFGPVPAAHLDRIGDVVAVCRDTYAVVATRSVNPVEARLVAYHGSITAAEMAIPLLTARG
ncbi:alkaline phosphatase family protein [Plantactinospora siamensis]|uniref:Alkaline phosphatase family protein n=1 Tax=Plantactinospora siamensis TaxID=555372 RepID=A0ABV6NZM9_9ACTN